MTDTPTERAATLTLEIDCMRPMLIALLISVASPVVLGDGVDGETINRIADEGFNHSELPPPSSSPIKSAGG